MRRVRAAPDPPQTGLVIEDRRVRLAGLALAALGATAAAAGVLHVSGPADTVAGAPRTVVATVGPQAAPQAVTAGAEVPRRIAADPMAAAQPALDLRQVVYTIAGNQRPHDPVTVVYADETGALRTVENVTLPWTMTIIPSLPVNYVTANSRGSQLNCWITDAAGATVASQTDYGISTTCNR